MRNTQLYALWYNTRIGGCMEQTYSEFVSVLLADKSVTNIALGLVAEAGEFANEVRKVTFQGHPLDRKKLIKELGDVRFYLQAAYDFMGVTDDEVIVENMEKLTRRYPSGFTPEASKGRTE